MIVEIDIDVKNGIASVTEKLDYGSTVKKKISLDEFLEIYTSYVKEKEDKYEFLYLPPGTVEYKKNINSVTYMVETNPYKDFYNVKDKEEDYLIVMKTDLSGKYVVSFRCYKTKGSFDKYFSAFTELINSDSGFEIESEDNGIKKCLQKALNSVPSKLPVRLRYKDIV